VTKRTTKTHNKLPVRSQPKRAASRHKTQMIELRGIAVQPDRMRALRPEVVDELVGSIKENGLLQPIIVRPGTGTSGYFLIAGRHRLEAAKKLKLEAIEGRILDGISADQALLAEIDENLIRADLTLSERASHHAERKTLYLKLNPETKKGANPPNKTKGGKGGKLKAQNEPSTPAYTKDAAKKTGKSRATVKRDVHRGENIDPKALADLNGTCLDKGDELDAMAKLPKSEQHKLAKRAKAGEKVSAKLQAKKLHRAEREVKLAKKIMALPDTKYGVIYADPPWAYPRWSEVGLAKAPEMHYPCETTEKIKKLPVASIAADDCVLFLWTTIAFAADGYEVMKDWGFKYVSQLIWKKDKTALGYWFRNEHEILLVGTVGKPIAPALGSQSLSVIEAAVREHSQKPDEVAEMIEAYFPNVPKIELHCRGTPRPGWSGWGAEYTTEDQPALVEVAGKFEQAAE
jgi:N6-adenosine-specific RNA methylase IME4